MKNTNYEIHHYVIFLRSFVTSYFKWLHISICYKTLFSNNLNLFLSEDDFQPYKENQVVILTHPGSEVRMCTDRFNTVNSTF